ncbi:protein of unknown function [Pseudomonas sp. JV241A]|nr:protein of unknown function [Pseudomonas sp. JV241A]
MEPKLLNFWETGVCGDLTGGMWDWTFMNICDIAPYLT